MVSASSGPVSDLLGWSLVPEVFWSLLFPNMMTTHNRMDRNSTNTTMQITNNVVLAYPRKIFGKIK